MFVFDAAPGEKMAEVINRTREEAKAKVSKVVQFGIFLHFYLFSLSYITIH